MNNYYEMAYLNWLGNQHEIKRIGAAIQKTYDLLTFQTNKNSIIDFNYNIGPYSIEEDLFLDKLQEAIDVDAREYVQTSLNLVYLNSLFKIVFAYDQDIDCAYREFIAFDPIHEQEINVHFFVIGKKVVDDRKRMIEFFTSLIMEFFNIYLESKKINIVGSPDDKYDGTGVSLRRCIDYFIIIFRILDKILDLKFDDWGIIFNELNGLVKMEKLKYVYDYAITADSQGANEDDYLDMVVRTIEEFEYPKPEVVTQDCLPVEEVVEELKQRLEEEIVDTKEN